MGISGDYPHPVNVNGYSCKNCTDVDYAKKHIDPAHPKSVPYGVTASSDPSVKFGGSLSHLNAVTGVAKTSAGDPAAPGRSL
ncbi:MAG: hypothetical protein JF615_16225, partial [Asticcacaulis sp.]|nr:hypothetical protein [Asticcacaulis sp.]